MRDGDWLHVFFFLDWIGLALVGLCGVRGVEEVGGGVSNICCEGWDETDCLERIGWKG